ncbi:MAG: hypothetical protein U5K54_30085 [Cytophagales bacterium]|nr:hypothetical protein [Cytophagales bacterium]
MPWSGAALDPTVAAVQTLLPVFLANPIFFTLVQRVVVYGKPPMQEISWTNISDGYFGSSIGAIAVSEWDNNVIYVGQGEVTVRGNVSYGHGIYKSTDAGKTWTTCGLKDSKHVPRIRIHPKNPDLVYAAVLGDLFKSSEERGVYRSEDGGKNWKRVLFANADAGAVDLCMDPNNPRISICIYLANQKNPLQS